MGYRTALVVIDTHHNEVPGTGFVAVAPPAEVPFGEPVGA